MIQNNPTTERIFYDDEGKNILKFRVPTSSKVCRPRSFLENVESAGTFRAIDGIPQMIACSPCEAAGRDVASSSR